MRVEAETTRTLEARPEPLPPPTGELTISSNIPGALLEVDGEPRGFAPTILSDVSIGEHTVALRSEGLDPFEGTVSVEPDVRSWLTISLVPPARTTRSEATWIVGGVGLAVLAASAVLYGFAAANRDNYDAIAANNAMLAMQDTAGRDLNPIRDQGIAISTAADVTLGVSISALGVAVALYFLTEETETVESSMSVAREER